MAPATAVRPPQSAPALPPVGATQSASAFTGADDCSQAALTPLFGPGTYPVDTTGSTAGIPPQACLGAGVTEDVWFYWISPWSGSTVVETCGLFNYPDSVITVWPDGSPPGSCPTGPALACNDDACFVSSSVAFPTIGGRGYFLQFGSHFAGFPYAHTFTIGNYWGGPPNDHCATPEVVSGPGPHLFDCSIALAAPQGQNEAVCDFNGTTAIDHDVWFEWTAPASGSYRLSLCGLGPALDTKLAVYIGSGCPQAPAIACSDDQCGPEPALCFAAQSGATYTFQIGTRPGTATQTYDHFRVDLQPPPPSGCRHDDGSSEDALGLGVAGEMGWIQRFGGQGESAFVGSVSVAFGSPAQAGSAPPVGTPYRAALWDDPNDDGDPSDAVLLAIRTGVIGSVDADAFESVLFCPPIAVSGVYFAGIALTHFAGEQPAALDRDGCPLASLGRSWIVGAPGGALDLAQLSSNPMPPTDLDALGEHGVWLVRAGCSLASTGTTNCGGDGATGPCPCGNEGATGHGCAHSANPAGALLTVWCEPSLAADSLLLTGTGLPDGSIGLYLQGTQATSAAFGDGRRCAAGTLVRLATKVSPGGASTFPGPGDPSVSLRCATYSPPQPIQPGDVRHYQLWYRNSAPFCTNATFNLTNSVTVLWQP